MRCRAPSRRRAAPGFALILVMIVIFSLGILAGMFAFSMKVESRLAANFNDDAELQWYGRSGVELARYVLAESFRRPKPASLNQIWAGGPGDLTETNGPLMDLNLRAVKLGDATLSIRIEDQERRANINRADPVMIERALELIGPGVADAATIADSLADWLDLDDDPHLSGAESDFYNSLTPPYYAKNGPMDDIAELLLVKGVTPGLFWGPRALGHRDQLYRPQPWSEADEALAGMAPIGLVDLFTAISSGAININTASAEVLQLLPGVDEVLAQNIIRFRAGPDGVDGTEDDTPFQNLGMLSPANVPGLVPEIVAEIQRLRLADVRSLTFHVEVEVRLGRLERTYSALVGMQGNVPVILQFSWP